MMVTTIVNRSAKSHCVENLVHWPYSFGFTATTSTHHSATIYQLGGREEATNSAWRLRDDGSEASCHGWWVRFL
jgi:hypothetical protein